MLPSHAANIAGDTPSGYEELNAYRAGLHSDAKSVCVIAAKAVRKPAPLPAEQYALLTAPFTAVGVAVPRHHATY